ncbi:hypothetical protein CVIRNUC_002841 [Coccomyxa viridis]|uniref:FAD dependent oxidoreductase domain-containing protein n=1 Tax=Coccomyxa viridis TaxID=1274662 RepID=A0AAV1I041_9CHLO|nr:hypothetical protein CVIRNUC_002841 [Coccomyxa viridis]
MSNGSVTAAGNKAVQTNPQGPGNVVIAGAGIMGCATAYYLSKLGVAATVVEKGEVACASSGKAGGFLALDWSDGGPVGPLARLSYSLHKTLASELGQDTGYREVRTFSVAASAKPGGRKANTGKNGPQWLDGNVQKIKEMAEEGTTAQVHPQKLTAAFMGAAQAAGAKLVRGSIQGIAIDKKSNSVTGVNVDGETIPADKVIIAMGPWSGEAAKWVPSAPIISGQKAHSILVRPTEPVGPDCLFTQFQNSSGRHTDPEVYPRPDGTVYICGESDSVSLPDDPMSIQPRASAMKSLQEVGAAISSALSQGKVEAEQACYLPVSGDSTPVIGKLPGVEGCYMASGHSCWGILNGPATGKVMAELVANGKATSLDISAFDPARFSKTRRGIFC